MPRWSGLVVATITLGLGAMAGAAQPSPTEWQERTAATLRRLVEEFTGPVAASCGIAWLPQARERATFFPSMEKEIAAALVCVDEARRRGQPAWAFWQFQGIDSTVFGGLATSPSAEVQTLDYDDFGGRARLTLNPCLNPHLARAPDLRIACDNRIQALSAPELAEAIARLERDVMATAGQDRRGLVARIARETAAASAASHPGFLTTVVDAVQVAIQDATGTNWPLCPRHGAHPLEFRDHRWFCARDRIFLGELGGLAAISGRLPP